MGFWLWLLRKWVTLSFLPVKNDNHKHDNHSNIFLFYNIFLIII